MMIKLFRRILSLSGRFQNRIKGAFVFAVLESILSKTPIILAFYVLNGFYQNSLQPKDCLFVGIALVLVISLQVVCHFMSDRLQSAAGYMMFADKRMELAGHLRKLPMGYFTAGNIGKISSVLSTDMVFIEEVAMSTVANMMSYMLSALILNVFMLFLNWRLGLVSVLVTVIATIIAERMNKLSLTEAAMRQEQSESLTNSVLSFTEGIGVIKSYNLLGEKSEELSRSFQKSRDTSIGFENKMVPWTNGLNVLYAIGIAAIFGLSIGLQQSGVLSLAYLCGVLLFVFDIFGPLKALYGESARLTVMNAALDRIDDVMNEVELPNNGNEHFYRNSYTGAVVRFNGVSFAYQDKDVLHDISFEIPQNSMCALVGPSGGGKSTIANLLARLWDVKSGNITIYGKDIRNVPLAELMEHISMVFQRVYLFQDTIYNNISMGKPDATEEEVHAAAKKARCYDFIMALPEGFQTVVGEGGATLSGGEKQRISIARCILKDAPVVILDEATASVDVDNESYIQEAISELVKGKTLLVIAHRLNTIRSADKILVISNGRMVQSGTHNELMNQDGIYHDYVNIRESASTWKIEG
jgi:ATP-binding cassette subfamily B protein IrtB